MNPEIQNSAKMSNNFERFIGKSLLSIKDMVQEYG